MCIAALDSDYMVKSRSSGPFKDIREHLIEAGIVLLAKRFRDKPFAGLSGSS